jgi:hydrogenase maturation protease
MTGLEHALREILARPTCIVGVGNRLRGDDAVGPHVADRLADEAAGGRLRVVNAEDVIENHVFRIADGDARNVLVVDAVAGAGAAPGSLVLGRLDELEAATGGFSTHRLALSMAGSVLRQHGKDVYLLGIAVANTEWGTGIGGDVQAGADAVVDMIRANGRE